MDRIALPHCAIDLAALTVTRGGAAVSLTSIEGAFLRYLAERRGTPVSRGEVLVEVWGYHPASRTNTIAVILRRLRTKIELDPSRPTVLRTVRGVGWLLHLPDHGSDPGVPLPARPATNLRPERDPFFGREPDLARLESPARLTTVLGTAGVGKTRLAREAGWRAVASGRAAELWFVDLAAALTREEVVLACFAALEVEPPADPSAAVGGFGRVLAARGAIWVVLDNLEQVSSEAAPVISAWLDAAPEATLVATSRVRLAIRGERLLVLGPLDVASSRALFVDRAGAHIGAWEIPAQQEVLLDEILDALGHSPLAVELAASRVDVLGLAGLRRGLDDRFALLRDAGRLPERHAALEVAIDWSFHQLSAGLREVFAQTAAFRGGFTFEAAAAVLVPRDGRDVAESVAGLLDRSLLRRVPTTGSLRFRTEVSLGDYARRRLADDPEQGAAVVARHVSFFASLGSRDATLALEASGGERHLADRVHDIPNLRAAVEQARAQGDRESASLACIALLEVCRFYGGALEAVGAARGLFADPAARDEVRVRLGASLASALVAASHTAEAHLVLDQAEELARRLEDRVYQSSLLTVRAQLLVHRAPAEAEALFLRSLELDRAFGLPNHEVVALNNLATIHWKRGDLDAAEAWARQASALATQIGFLRAELDALGSMALVALSRGDLERARSCWQAVASRAEHSSYRIVRAYAVLSLADCDAAQGLVEQARLGFEVAHRLFQQAGERGPAAVALGNLGTVQLEAGDLVGARASLEVAVSELRELAWLGALGAFSAGLGEVLASTGDLAAGRALVLAGLDTMREVGEPQIGAALCALARVHLLEGDPTAARLAVQEAEDTALKYGFGTGGGLRREIAALRARLDAGLDSPKQT